MPSRVLPTPTPPHNQDTLATTLGERVGDNVKFLAATSGQRGGATRPGHSLQLTVTATTQPQLAADLSSHCSGQRHRRWARFVPAPATEPAQQQHQENPLMRLRRTLTTVMLTVATIAGPIVLAASPAYAPPSCPPNLMRWSPGTSRLRCASTHRRRHLARPPARRPTKSRRGTPDPSPAHPNNHVRSTHVTAGQARFTRES
jgi:hypothetical protein